MTERKILEEAYFHTGNSGMTFLITEDKNYRLTVRHSAFGSYSTLDLPIGSVHVCEWLIEALQRTRENMTEKNFDHEYAFGYAKKEDINSYIEIKKGLKKVDIEEPYVSDNGRHKGSKIIGYNLVDEKGTIVETEMLSDPVIYSEGDDSSSED